MKNVCIKKRGLKRGFTLIELMVSMVIFVIFMAIVASSFVEIVRAQKETNEVRKMYAEVRSFVDLVSEEARLGTVDYDCYATVAQSFMNACPKQLKPITSDGRTTDLALVRKDGMQKTIFRFDSVNQTVKVVKYDALAGGGWAPAAGYTDFSDIMGNQVKVTRMSFVINPDMNPYSGDKTIYSNGAKQFQPQVTIFMSVSNRANVRTPLGIDYQTTISSRVYNR